MGLKLITAPAAEPVTAAEVKATTGLTAADGMDTVIDSRIKEAREYVEQVLGRALITQTWELSLDCFDAETIELPKPPAASVTSIKYLDTDNAEQTLPIAYYTLDDYIQPAAVVLNSGYSWPGTYAAVNAVKVRYVAGYGAAAASVPGPIKEAIMIIVGHWMRFQPAIEAGISITRIPMAALDLLQPYRVIRF